MARREWQSDLGIFQNEIAEVTRVLPTTVNKATLATDLSHARNRIFRQSGEVSVRSRLRNHIPTTEAAWPDRWAFSARRRDSTSAAS
jgi:hypothetical protein